MNHDELKAELASLLGSGGGYEPPRVISHSAQHLRGMTIDINACNSQFGGGALKDSESDKEDDEAVAY